MAGRIHDRFLRDERRVALVATLLTSVAAAAVAAQLVSLWASIVEMIRLDDAHMTAWCSSTRSPPFATGG
jgi:hypothetical protein